MELRTQAAARLSRELVLWDVPAKRGPDLSHLDLEKVFPEVRVVFEDHLAELQVPEPFADIVGSLLREAPDVFSEWL